MFYECIMTIYLILNYYMFNSHLKLIISLFMFYLDFPFFIAKNIQLHSLLTCFGESGFDSNKLIHSCKTHKQSFNKCGRLTE